MKLRPPFIFTTGEEASSVGRNSKIWTLVSILFFLLLMVKVLWGYWERGLTLGDTSFYFQKAVCWYESGTVDIIWSPLYTAYYGTWLNVSENAITATFLHRLGLIVFSTALVAWIGLLSLPRALAVLLVSWWLVLPIHYDTLYEVHLFGTLPLLMLVIVSMAASDSWRMPLLIGISLVTTVLVRNEYILALLVFGAISIVDMFRNRRRFSWRLFFSSASRYAVIMLTAGVLISFFYSASFIKGAEAKAHSIPKHTVNMCQVYAFGYQQRNPSWNNSPWTDCSKLMEEKFGKPRPSLKEMIIANPMEVAKHFLWNLGLTRAGMEVLLFNATTSTDNPDYAPVAVKPVWPSISLALTLIILIGGAIQTFIARRKGVETTQINLARMGPVMLAVALLSIAVITTQRPRPSYLLGLGVVYIWLVLTYVWRFTERYVNWNSAGIFLSLIVLILVFVPSYRDLYGSKTSIQNQIYQELYPYQEQIYNTPGRIAMDGFFRLVNFIKPPLKKISRPWAVKKTVSYPSLPPDTLTDPVSFVTALENLEVGTAIISPLTTRRHPALQGCHSLRSAFLEHGWVELSSSDSNDKHCVAVFIKTYKTSEE